MFRAGSGVLMYTSMVSLRELERETGLEQVTACLCRQAWFLSGSWGEGSG